MISITEAPKEDVIYTENETTINLDQRVARLIVEAERDFSRAPGLHVMRIDGLSRNLVISRMAHYLAHKDALPLLRSRIEDFYGQESWIVGVANYHYSSSRMFHMIAPFRHHNVTAKMRAELGDARIAKEDHDQGFLLYRCGDLSYVGREEALIFAAHNGQLRRRAGNQHYQGDQLFSEDLW